MLSMYNKQLLYQTRKKAFENQWKFVWFSNNHIKCRKQEGSKIITIYEEKDIQKLN